MSRFCVRPVNAKKKPGGMPGFDVVRNETGLIAQRIGTVSAPGRAKVRTGSRHGAHLVATR